ncbi:MAG TPA: Ig-like domain repeat protein [Geobacteraceae bacterium]|nr:Ig-like domain repeat protein [Geobacteraceae bacterium]
MRSNTVLLMLFVMLVGLITPGIVSAGTNTWTGTGPFATGLGDRVITALALSPDGKTVYSGTASGTVFSYAVIPPTAVTNAATGILAIDATLNGTVNANSLSTAVSFDYGHDTTYGSSITAAASPVSGTTDTAVSAAVTGLVPGATYHYRAVAVNTSGTTYGGDQSFTLNKAATTTGLTSSPNPSTAGQQVTFTATVTGVTIIPAGTVTFMDGPTTIGTATLGAGGQATFTTSTLAAGAHSITATYGGNANYDSSSAAVTQTANEASAITSASSATFTIGAAGTFTVIATGYPAPTLSESGALPSGVTFNAATGVLSGTPAVGTDGVYHITLAAHNTSGADATQNFTLTVNRVPTITSADNATFTIGAAGTFTVTAGGYPAPTLSETGTLPSGITFNAATGVLSGTPAVGTNNVYNLIFTASNGVSSNATQNFTLTVQFNASPPTLTVSTLSDGAVTTSPVLNISGSVTGPNGIQSLTLNGTTVPLLSDGGFSFPIQLALGANNIIIVATDNAGHQTTSTRTITLTPTAPSLTITSPADGSTSTQTMVPVTGTSSAATVEASVNGGAALAAAKTNNNFTVTVNLAAGMNTIVVTATDAGSNTSSAKLTIFSNSSAPDLAVTSPANDLVTADQTITLTGTASSSTSPPVTVNITLDGQTYTPAVATGGAFQQQLNLSAEKNYDIVVTATDANSNTATVQRNVIYSLTSSGDINGDGKIDIADALMAMKVTVNLMTLNAEQLKRGDVAPLVNSVSEPDGTIGLDDAILILRKAVGLGW